MTSNARGRASGVELVDTKAATIFTVRDGQIVHSKLYPERRDAFSEAGIPSRKPTRQVRWGRERDAPSRRNWSCGGAAAACGGRGEGVLRRRAGGRGLRGVPSRDGRRAAGGAGRRRHEFRHRRGARYRRDRARLVRVAGRIQDRRRRRLDHRVGAGQHRAEGNQRGGSQQDRARAQAGGDGARNGAPAGSGSTWSGPRRVASTTSWTCPTWWSRAAWPETRRCKLPPGGDLTRAVIGADRLSPTRPAGCS